MKTLILKTASNYLLPVLLVFSVFILLRGHYLPGGGFVGGLIAAIAFVLHAFANGLDKSKDLLKIHPGFLMPPEALFVRSLIRENIGWLISGPGAPARR